MLKGNFISGLTRASRRLLRRLLAAAAWRISSLFICRRAQLMRISAVWMICEEEEIGACLPGTVGHSRNHRRILARAGATRIEPAFVAQLDRADFVGPWATAITRCGRIVGETFFHRSRIGIRDTLSLKRAPVDRDLDCACSLVHRKFYEYFHWLFDCLMHLHGLELYAAETGRRPLLLVNRGLRPWHRQYLAILDYRDGDLVEWNCTRVRVDRAVIPSRRRFSERTGAIADALSPDACRWMRARLTRAIGDTASPISAEKIYISREKAGRRKVRNEGDVIALLRGLGFEIVVLEDFSAAQQIALFSQVRFAVSVHGSGLANMVFAPDGAKILEIFPDAFVRPDFLQLCKAHGFSYGYLIQHSEPDAAISSTAPNEVDVRVNLDELNQLIAKMI